MSKIQLLFPVFILFCSCGIQQNNNIAHSQEIHELPDDLTNIQEDKLYPILSMLGDAKIIGVSEGTHGMIEPFFWRNELIKYLVKKDRISAVVLESGLVESRLIYDYVNGRNLDLDSVITHGIQCGFGRFRQNRELLIWLREYNSSQSDDKKIHIYGFDLPGCAPNPVLENAMAGFEYVLKYFKEVDLMKSEFYTNQLVSFKENFRIRDNEEDTLKHFTDIDSVQWKKLKSIQKSIEADLISNSENYISKSSQLEYDWALLGIIGAKQNIDFLYSITHSEIEYAPREKGLFENVKWIREKEKGKSILLFAHLAHLAKEIHMKDGKMAHPMCGEYLGEEFGNDYKVIGNIYKKLDWFEEGQIVLEEGTIASKIENYGTNNFFMELNKKDTLWNREWAFGKPSSGGQVYMIPSQGMDIIFFNKVQTWIDAERYR